MPSVDELHSRGVAATNSGRFRSAQRLLTRAYERAQGADQLARVEASLAYLSADLGDADGAFALCASALSRSGISDETRGIVESQRALLHMRRGETAQALADFASAIGSLTGSPSDLGKALLNRGGVFLQQGDPGLASRDFAEAQRWLAQAGQPVEAAMAAHNLGYADLLRGNLIEALAAFDSARSVLAPLSPVSRAICEQDRAEVLMAAGLVEEGQAALREAARAYGLRRLHQRRGEAELVLARSQLINDPAEALAAARAARSRFLRSGSDAWRVRAEGVAVGAQVELGSRGPSLVAQADRVADQLRAQGLESSAALTGLHAVRVLVRRGSYDEAAGRLRRVQLRGSTPLSVRMLARTARLELHRARGRRAAAAREARLGLDDLHAWVSTFGSLDLQTSVVGRGRELALNGLELALESGRTDLVFEWSERARMLVSRMRPIRPPSDDQVAADLTELRQLHTQDDHGGGPRETQLRARVRERALRLVGSGELTDPASLAQVRDALGPERALVAYVVTDADVAALVVTEGTARLVRLGHPGPVQRLLGGLFPDLDMAGSDIPEPFAAAVRRELVARLADLGELLVAPLLTDLGDRGLVLTPSGLLAGVPWGLLPGMHGRPITVAQSATSWLMRGQRPVRHASAGFVAGPRVARAEEEVVAAGALWPGATVLTGERATAAAVSDLAARVDVLHVSAHGRHSAENPLFSGVELVDGPWFGYDIDQLGEVPDLVVLSACEVGRSEVRYGEELIGMTAAWLHAGARAVIASAAAVNDEVAHDVLLGVHRGLRGGLDPAAALAASLPPATDARPPAPFAVFS